MKRGKEVALSIERQHTKHVKHYYRTIAEINLELAKIHKNLHFTLNKEKYQHVTEFVNKYISYTTVWNIKFVYNLENPEVALLQIFHLEYIFDREPLDRYETERRIYTEQKEHFRKTEAYTQEHIQLRKKGMLDFIAQQEQKSTIT